MKNFILILFFLSLSNYAISQDLRSIQTDRPDQTECPFITPVNYFQIENGFNYEKIKPDSKTIATPIILTKFGINEHLELRLITEFTMEENNSDKISGMNPVLIGFKSRLFEEKGFIPTTSFIGHLSIPKLASSDLKATYYSPEFRFTMQHTISSRQTISYNLGAEWSGITLEPTFIYTLTTGYSFTEKVGGYIEFFGFIPQITKPDHRFDGGLTYLFNPNHQLDISAGLGLSKISPEYYAGLGYSYRFKI
jgi:hypothetical protein